MACANECPCFSHGYNGNFANIINIYSAEGISNANFLESIVFTLTFIPVFWCAFCGDDRLNLSFAVRFLCQESSAKFARI